MSLLWLLLLLMHCVLICTQTFPSFNRNDELQFISVAPQTTAAGQVPNTVSYFVKALQKTNYAFVIRLVSELRPELPGTQPTSRWGPFVPGVVGLPFFNHFKGELPDVKTAEITTDTKAETLGVAVPGYDEVFQEALQRFDFESVISVLGQLPWLEGIQVQPIQEAILNENWADLAGIFGLDPQLLTQFTNQAGRIQALGVALLSWFLGRVGGGYQAYQEATPPEGINTLSTGDVRQVTSAPVSLPRINHCYPFAYTFSPKVMIVFGVTYGVPIFCNLEAGRQYEFIYPEEFSAPNPEYPQVLVNMGITWLDANFNYLWFYGVGSSGEQVQVPWLTTDPELETSHLRFTLASVDNTIQGNPINRLDLAFTLGMQLIFGDYFAIEASQYIFQQVLGDAPVKVAVGYGDCDAQPTSPYCCRDTAVYSRGIPAIDRDGVHLTGSLIGSSLDRNLLLFKLGPVGCVLPADKPIKLSILSSTGLLGHNPDIPNRRGCAWGLGVAAIGDVHCLEAVYLRMLTSAEPTPVLVQRYGYPSIGWNAPSVDGPFITSYVVGSSAVKDFVATPSNLLTCVVPNSLTLSFTLVNGFADTLTRKTLLPPFFVITANQGVFKPNVGYQAGRMWHGFPFTQTFLPRVLSTNLPVSCGAVFTTTAYGTLVIYPITFLNADCVAGFGDGSRLTFTIPSDALLPNPTPQDITFDVRVHPGYNHHSGCLTNSVDSATLMNARGYTTIAACSQMPSVGLFGNLGAICSLPAAQRCLLVATMSQLSHTTGGILQCPAMDHSLVTYVKYGEGTWTQQHWPGTTIAGLGNWPQEFAKPPAPPAVVFTLGYMISVPMFAILVSYPPTQSTLTSLGVSANVPRTWILVFVVRLDRFTYSCQVADDFNPWAFAIRTQLTILQVWSWAACGDPAGTPVTQVGHWSQGNGQVIVVINRGGAVAGWAGTAVSPIPVEDGSDDALFGLLALIAIPLLLCCCLAALLWFLLRPKPPCPQQCCTVQECWMEPMSACCMQPEFLAPSPAHY